MKKNSLLSIFLILCLAITGCSSFGGGSSEYDEADMTLSEQELAAQTDLRFGDGSIPTAEGEGLFLDVNFDFDSSGISSIGQQSLDYNVQVLRQNPTYRVQLEGHCDERGTDEYNMALGQKRARMVYEALVAADIAPERLSTISYGREVPLDPGHNESAYAKNRRVHFSVIGRGSNNQYNGSGNSNNSYRDNSERKSVTSYW